MYKRQRTCRPEELRGGNANAQSLRAVALEATGRHVRVGDVVTVDEGPLKGHTGTIKHIAKTVLFLHSSRRQQHAGMMVAKARQCTLDGNKKQARGPLALAASYMGLADNENRAAAAAKRKMQPGARDRDPLLSKTVRIRSCLLYTSPSPRD